VRSRQTSLMVIWRTLHFTLWSISSALIRGAYNLFLVFLKNLRRSKVLLCSICWFLGIPCGVIPLAILIRSFVSFTLPPLPCLLFQLVHLFPWIFVDHPYLRIVFIFHHRVSWLILKLRLPPSNCLKSS
jgi:hypothetical protein